jgi:DNA adenine methylase
MVNINSHAKPFVKWAGGKRGIIETYENNGLFIDEFKKYFEPMIGAGAVYFHIKENYNPKKCIISDINFDLINTYKVIKNDVNQLIDKVSTIKDVFFNSDNQLDFYYKRRNEFNELKKDKKNNLIHQASLFLFLNKTCYNGLYRVNKKDEFNVPFGQYKNPTIYDEDNLRRISKLLKNTIILNQDFEKTIENAEKEDFIYFDPPYAPISNTSDFTSYTKMDFGIDEQKRLAKVVNNLAKKGCYVMESNSSSKEIKIIFEEYKNLNIYTIEAPRYINCKSEGRKPIEESVIINYEPKVKQKKISVY